MKLFRFYSTAKNNKSSCDILINLEKIILDCIRPYFDNDEDKKFFAIHLEYFGEHTRGQVRELHDDINFTRERIREILAAFGAPLDEAEKFSKEMRFIIG